MNNKMTWTTVDSSHLLAIPLNDDGMCVEPNIDYYAVIKALSLKFRHYASMQKEKFSEKKVAEVINGE